jgi:hypothetical protein
MADVTYHVALPLVPSDDSNRCELLDFACSGARHAGIESALDFLEEKWSELREVWLGIVIVTWPTSMAAVLWYFGHSFIGLPIRSIWQLAVFVWVNQEWSVAWEHFGQLATMRDQLDMQEPRLRALR